MATISDATKKASDKWDSVRDAAADDPAMRPGPVLTCLADVEPAEIRWLWRDRVPLGRLTLLVGRPGEGKSFFTTDIAARISTGTPFPDGAPCERGSVLLICGEDDPADTIRPRLDAHRADVSRIHLLSMVRRMDAEAKLRETIFTLADVAALETAIAQIQDCRLIVIDPIGSYLGGSTDAHRDNEVRGVLAPVAALAAKYGAAVLVVAHRRKSSGSVADDLALGSRAFTGIARSVWHLCRQADADDNAKDAEAITAEKSPVRLLLPGKMNLCAQPDGLAFAISGEPARLAWSREPVTMSADDALAVENSTERDRPGPAPEARNEATDWLRAELVDLAEHPVAQLRENAQAAGMAWRTVERARSMIGALSHRATFGGGYIWRLPRPGTDGDAPADDDPAMPATMPAMAAKKEITWRPGEQGETPTKTDDSARQVPLSAELFSLGGQGEDERRIGLPDAPEYEAEYVASIVAEQRENGGGE